MVSLNVANTNGKNRQSLLWAPIRIVGWFPDGQTLLLQISSNSEIASGLWELDILNRSLSKLLEASNIRAVRISPDGRYISYIRALEPDPTLAGLWILNTTDHTTTKLGISGSYAWHPTSTGLLIIPPRPSGVMNHQIWWANTQGSSPIPITDPLITHLQISNFEWALSPDGRRVAYREAEFLSLRAIDLGFALDVLVPMPSIPKPWGQHNYATITGYPSGW
jgi:Tol biopolymer transport system component